MIAGKFYQARASQMKVRVTSIAWKEVAELVRSVGVAMQAALTVPFQELSFGAGIDQLTIIVISVSSDTDENARVCRGYDKVSKHRHPFSGEQVRSIGFAVPIDPDALVTMMGRDLTEMICTTVIDKLDQPYPRLPRGFDYALFARHLREAIADYRLAWRC
jgi:hypothetical protein